MPEMIPDSFQKNRYNQLYTEQAQLPYTQGNNEANPAPIPSQSPEPPKNVENFPTITNNTSTIRKDKRLYPIKPKESKIYFYA